MPITAHRNSDGRSSGSVMRKKRAQAGAPSIRAASYRCGGNALQPGQQDDHVEAEHLPEIRQDTQGSAQPSDSRNAIG